MIRGCTPLAAAALNGHYKAACLLVDCWRFDGGGERGVLRRSTVDALALADAFVVL